MGRTDAKYIDIIEGATPRLEYWVLESAVSATAVASSDEIQLSGHGLNDNDRVAIDRGGGLDTDVLYHVISADADSFQVSLSQGGSAVALTDGSVRYRKSVPGSAIDTMTVTVYGVESGAVVTGWEDKDIDGAENNSVSSAGIGVWDPVPSAAIAKASSGPKEDFVMTITWAWDTPTKTGVHQVLLRVTEGY